MHPKIDRNKFLEDGYLIVPQAVPPDRLDQVREACELLVDRQRETWAAQRGPDDPPGGEWETGGQPQFLIFSEMVEHINETTAPAVGVCLEEKIHCVCSELLDLPDAAVTEMTMMCSPQRDHGPAAWHRDLHPIDSAPLQGYIDDIEEGGPRYVQWNIALYDDDVLCVMPGSHRRRNTDEENRLMAADPCRPLPGYVQTKLKAGDGVVYILPILHWACNYSSKLRRTVIGGFSDYAVYGNPAFIRQLADPAREAFERWDRRSHQRQDQCETAMRAVIDGNGRVYLEALDALHPQRGAKGRILTTIFLCKQAAFIYCHHHRDCVDGPGVIVSRGHETHSQTFIWGPTFTNRFSVDEAERLWQRFTPIDQLLQDDQEQFEPGFQQGPMPYYFNRVPAELSVENWIAQWSD